MTSRIVQVGFLLAACSIVRGQLTESSPSPVSQRLFLNHYCAYCHNDTVKAGSMTLSRLNVEHPEQTAELAEKIIRKLRVGLMPPPGTPKPDSASRGAFVVALESAIDRAAAAHPSSANPPLHRLNRTEYANSIRDLLGVQMDVSELLPPDDMSHGFDNMADVLTVSPTLMEAYVRAAGKISRVALGDPEARPITVTYSIPAVLSQARHINGTPFGTRGGISVLHNFPADGDYVFKLGFFYISTGPLFGVNQGKGQQIEVAVDGARVALFDIDPSMTQADDGIKTPPIRIRAGAQRISASFIQKADGPVEDEVRMVEQSLVDLTTGAVPGVTTLPHLRELSITGPTHMAGISDTPSRGKIFVCRPRTVADELPCATRIVSALGRQAYRRTLNAQDVSSLIGFYKTGRDGAGFDSGIRAAIQAIIASPEFVFRFERAPRNVPPGSNYPITGVELASRLSYFLWSSAPDEHLRLLARRDALRNPAVLEGEVRRMLADPRSEALVANFADQWLHLQNLKEATPDLMLFPNFDKRLAEAMQRETELLFDDVMREDRSILDLLTANYTFVNERLARHYGIPNVMGNRFRRVAITDENRRGLLGQAAILTLTSTANRTSPVQRGKYVMQVLLGTPPPPPPPNVPALTENSEARTDHVTKLVSVRDRMEAHRKAPVCAACHKLMDPIGFALENFDAVGVWRRNDGAAPVDASGNMFDGTSLNGPVSLRNAILSHSDAFIRTFTENLLAYGLGRVTDYRDMPVVRSIARKAGVQDNRFSAFVLGIVASTPFQTRQVETSPSETTERAAIQPRR